MTTMEMRNDDLQPVTQLIISVSETLEDSRQRTARIDELIGKISQYRTIVGGDDSDSQDKLQEQTDKAIRLRDENLQIMLEIQRQEYTASKWTKLLAQNEDLLDSIMKWLRDSKGKHTVEEIRVKAESIVEKLEWSRESLLEDAQMARHDIVKLQEITKGLEDCLDGDLEDLDMMIRERERLATELKFTSRIL
jgi:ribosomal protein L3